MIYGSVCSGIEAASIAWAPLGWTPAFFSEIEAFPRAVLSHHYGCGSPNGVPLHGDFTTIKADDYGPIDLLVGGTPCQSFSIAGLRGGMGDDRGNLALEFLRLAERKRPTWILWENVPGVLSSLSHDYPDACPPNDPMDLECDGQEMDVDDEYDSEELHAFNCFLAGLSELGYGFSYRLLDAQFFGLAQRRERVFVVGYLGDWRPAAAVFLEQDGLRWNPPPSRETGQSVTGTLSARTEGGGGLGTDFDLSGGQTTAAFTPSSHGDNRHGCGTIRANGGDLGGGSETLLAFGGNNSSGAVDVAAALAALAALAAHGGPHGRQDFASETFKGCSGQDANHGHSHLIPTAYTLHGADKTVSTATETDVAGSVRTKPPGSIENSSTTCVLQPIAFNHQSGGDFRPQPSVGVANALQRSQGQAVAFAQNTRDEIRLQGGDGKISGALAAEPGMKQQTYVAFSCKDRGADASDDLAPTMRAMGHDGSHANAGGQLAVALNLRGREGGSQMEESDVASLRSASGGSSRSYVAQSAVRRLTPTECERLQGFPDGYTDVPYRGKHAADGPRYKSLGNSMAVPVMAWIGERIALVDRIVKETAAKVTE